jgi:biotin carboxyl carrier protein
MNPIIENTRALLRLFEQSGRRDLYLRTGDYRLFIARKDGGDNPMRAEGAATDALQLTAPHVATLNWTAAVGTNLAIGDSIARLSLLDEIIELQSEHAGRVTSVDAETGQLLEYGDAILTLVH